MYENDNDFNTLVPGAKKDRHREILDQLQQMDVDDGYIPVGNDDFDIPAPKPSDYNTNNVLPSNFLTKKNKKKKHTIQVPDQTEDEWLSALMDANDVKIKRSGKRGTDIFDEALNGKKKKKKKNKDKNEPTDYKKEFETEAALLRNLMIDQSHFVESLQKEYDFLKSNKSSSRGINKNMTDLIANITSARSLTTQLVEKQIALKKSIADLTMKERKELSGGLTEGENLADFASSYLKQMISERQQLLTGGSTDIGDYSIDEMSNILNENMNTGDYEDRPDEVEKYLEYEDRNVTVWVYMNQNDSEDYEYVALDEDGEEIDDYPLPYKNKLSINRSTNIATDTFGQKYPIRWR